MPANDYNPFAARSEYSPRALLTYRVLGPVGWIISWFTTWYYVMNHGFWHWNHYYHTAFSLNPVMVDIFWVLTALVQLFYVGQLFSGSRTTEAASVSNVFFINSVMQAVTVGLISNHHFITAEILLGINTIMMLSSYSSHYGTRHSHAVHWSVLSAPLAWSIIAMYWVGALCTPFADALLLRILGNVFIWTLFFIGLLFVLVYADWRMGYCFTYLVAALAVGQFFTHVVALQWIFGFTIMGLLFFLTTIVALPAWFGERYDARRAFVVPASDAERDPLLRE
jgi:hypothetical protein